MGIQAKWSDLHSDVVLHRLVGAKFPAIAMLLGVSINQARYYCRSAVKRGFATRDQLRLTNLNQPLKIPEESYNDHWIARIRSRTEIDGNGCWVWRGAAVTKGYGSTFYRRDSVRIHRKYYEIANNVTLTFEQQVCHRCDVPRCWNPAHLFLGSNAENMADKTAKGRHHELRVTHCPRGHEYTTENTYRSPGKPTARQCRACMKIRYKEKAA